MTVVVAGVGFFLIAPWPEECTFLKSNEKRLLLVRLTADNRGTLDRLDKQAFMRTLTDWKIWAGLVRVWSRCKTKQS